MIVTRHGEEYKLIGELPKVDEQAPDFVLFSEKNQEISKESLKGQVTILSVVPNINTSVCDMQTRRFNQEASTLEGVQLITIAKNSAEEFANWCASAGLDMTMLSDMDLTFGKAYGIAMDQLDVLARSVFVLDKDGKLVYYEIVEEMVDEPDYQEALDVAKELAKA